MKVAKVIAGSVPGFLLGLIVTVLIVVALEYLLANDSDADEWRVNGKLRHGHCDVITGHRLLILCEDERTLCIFTVNETDHRESGWQCADKDDEEA